MTPTVEANATGSAVVPITLSRRSLYAATALHKLLKKQKIALFRSGITIFLGETRKLPTSRFIDTDFQLRRRCRGRHGYSVSKRYFGFAARQKHSVGGFE